MPQTCGEVLEIWLDGYQTAGLIACPASVHPRPGQYVWARALDPPTPAVLPAVLYPGYGEQPVGDPDREENAWIAAPALPPEWTPGTRLELRGPLGTGFALPPVSRLALAALGDTPARLLALSGAVMENGGSVSLITDLPVPAFLPAQIEVIPLSGWEETLAWADFLAVDLPLAAKDRLVRSLPFPPGTRSSLPGQALLHTPMPCCGAADCGVCAVHTHKGWKLACKDGPVFDLRDLEW